MMQDRREPAMLAVLRSPRSWAACALVLFISMLGNQRCFADQIAAPGQTTSGIQPRPPAIEILRSMEENGGWGLELHRVTIQGVGLDPQGQPVANADVYVSDRRDRLYGPIKTQQDGRFVFTDVQLEVHRWKPDPVQQPIEAQFVVFGVADGCGFTWHRQRSYRPYMRPAGVDLVDGKIEETRNAFYRNEPIFANLTFAPAAKLQGRVTDDLGAPIPGAKVQLGYVDGLGKHGTYICRRLEHDGDRSDRFGAISDLPTELREAITDEDGRYEFNQLPRESLMLGLIQPGPEFTRFKFSLATTQPSPKLRGVLALGHDAKLDRSFFKPRRVIVKLVDKLTGTPASRVSVTAENASQTMRPQSTGMTNAEGVAVLKLTPATYTLRIEPGGQAKERLDGQPEHPSHESKPQPIWVYAEHELTVHADKSQVDFEVSLERAAAVAIRVVDDLTGDPVSDLRLNYTTDSNSEPRVLHSQTVYADYATTNAQGQMQAWMQPGKRRFFAADSPESKSGAARRSSLVELIAGRTTNVELRVRRAAVAKQLKLESKPEPGVGAQWIRQAKLLRDTNAIVQIRIRSGGSLDVEPAELLAELRKLDPDASDNIGGKAVLDIIQRLTGQRPGMSKMLLTSGRGRIREEHVHSAAAEADSTQTYPRTSIANGVDALSYDSANNQANLHDARNSRRHITNLHDFCSWPRGFGNLPQPTETNGRLVFEMKQSDRVFRMICDKDSGFITESCLGKSLENPSRVDLYFNPREYRGGLILPGLHIGWRQVNGKISSFNMHLVDDVQILDALPANAFALALPSGCHVIDERGVPRNAPRDARHHSLRCSVNDIAAWLERNKYTAQRIEGPIRYGNTAPELEIAHWLNLEGPTSPPDLEGKAVFIDFWGVGCGPCVAALPDIVRAAKFVQAKGGVFIGLHESEITVEALRTFAEQHHLDYPLAVDKKVEKGTSFGKSMQAWGVRGIRTCAVIDQQGNVQYVGHLADALQAFERARSK